NAQSDSLPAGYTAGQGVNVIVSAGQAAQANLTLSGVTAHLLGKAVDTNGTPQSGLAIQASPSNGGNGPQVNTAADGTFDLGGNQTAYFAVQSPTTHLRGKVVNDSGTPQSGLAIQAFPSGNGNGPQVITGGDGSFDLGVSGGSWTVQLNGDSAAANNVISPNV